MLATFECAGVAAGRAARLHHVQLAQEFLARVSLEHPHARGGQRFARHRAHLAHVRNVVHELRGHVGQVQQPHGFAAVLEIRVGLLEIFRDFVVDRRPPLDDGARQQLAGHGLGQGSDFVDRVLGRRLVAVERRGAEIVEMPLTVLVNADAQAHAVVLREPGASQVADGAVEGRGLCSRGGPWGRPGQSTEKSSGEHSWARILARDAPATSPCRKWTDLREHA